MFNPSPEIAAFFGAVTRQINSEFVLEAAKLIVTGVIAAIVTLNTFATDITTLKAHDVAQDKRMDAHEKQNAEYREKTEKEKLAEDRKWDARITRLEGCFIQRNCGTVK